MGIIMHTSPILYRYIDWSITVPLQMIEFNLILVAVKPDISSGMFWRLMLGTVAMLAFGYAGETHSLGPFGAWLGFVLGMSGWGYILFEIFAGEAGSIAGGGGVNKYVASSFKTMRFIVTVGWSIYPLGYFFGYLMGSVEACILNLIYNLADFVNKIAFCPSGHAPNPALWKEQSERGAGCRQMSNVWTDSVQASFSFFTAGFPCNDVRKPCTSLLSQVLVTVLELTPS